MHTPVEPISCVVRHVPRDHRRSIRANRRGLFWRNRIAGGSLLVAGVVLMFTADNPLQLVAIVLIVVGLVMVARSWLLPWAVVRRLPASAYVEHQLDVDDQGIRQTAAHISVQLSWSGFVSASRDRHVWILRHKDGGPPTMIARRHLTDDQESRLTSLLRARRLLVEP